MFGEGGVDLILGGVPFIPAGGLVVSSMYFESKYILQSTGDDFWNKKVVWFGIII